MHVTFFFLFKFKLIKIQITLYFTVTKRQNKHFFIFDYKLFLLIFYDIIKFEIRDTHQITFSVHNTRFKCII